MFNPFFKDFTMAPCLPDRLHIQTLRFCAAAVCLTASMHAAHAQAASAAWEPTAPVELVVPAGTGGGADQMARFVADMVARHRLMKQPLTVVNKPGNSGAEGLLDMKASQGNPHKLAITLSNVFTVPLATGIDFSWRDLTPVQMLALDPFVLWVNAKSAFQSPKEVMEALRTGTPRQMKLGGTGSKQEDQLIGVLLETAAANRLDYVPLQGGGAAAQALAAREVDLTVNNPIEAAKLWAEGQVRPLCVLDGVKLAYPTKIAEGKSWADLPTCLSFGIPVQYQMMRSIFTTPGATPGQVAYYSEVLGRVRALPEWQAFMAQGAFSPTTLKGAPLVAWLERSANFHRTLMREAKLTFSRLPASAAAEPKK